MSQLSGLWFYHFLADRETYNSKSDKSFTDYIAQVEKIANLTHQSELQISMSQRRYGVQINSGNSSCFNMGQHKEENVPSI